MSRNPKQTSTGISLLTLAFGFSLLGILSFLNRLQGELAIASAVENNFCVAGSVRQCLGRNDIPGRGVHLLEAVRGMKLTCKRRRGLRAYGLSSDLPEPSRKLSPCTWSDDATAQSSIGRGFQPAPLS